MKIQVTLEIPDYSLEEMSSLAVQFFQLDRPADAVDMMMAVLDGDPEITYRVESQEATDD